MFRRRKGLNLTKSTDYATKIAPEDDQENNSTTKLQVSINKAKIGDISSHSYAILKLKRLKESMISSHNKSPFELL